MIKNKLKRYSSLHELELDLDEMNNNEWYVTSISDCWNRVLVIYEKVLEDNNIQDVWWSKEMTQEENEWVESWWIAMPTWGDININDDDMAS